MPRQTAAYATIVTLLCVTMILGTATAVTAQPNEQHVDVTLRQGAAAVTPKGTLGVTVRTTLSQPAEYFEVRLRAFRPDGRLLYQKTEVRHDVEAGASEIGFSRELADLSVAPGRYPLEVRVLATGSGPTNVEDRMLVIDPDVPPLPVAVVVRIAETPGLDPTGRFAIDPAARQAPDSAIALSTYLLQRPGARCSLAVAPVTLEEWSRAAAGYEATSSAASQTVPPDSEVPVRYATTLESIAEAVGTGRLQLLDVPYAEPDLAGLAGLEATADLVDHLALGSATFTAALGLEPSAGATIGGAFTPQAIAPVETAGITHVVVRPGAVRTTGQTTAAGPVAIEDTGLTALVTDAELAVATGNGERAIEDRLFDLAFPAQDTARPAAAVALIDVGPETTAADAIALLDTVQALPWTEAVTAEEASVLRGAATVTLADDAGSSAAPTGYWDEVAGVRRRVHALESAVGATDPVLAEATRSLLIAESGLWENRDAWERGRGYAATARDTADRVFSAVTLDVRDVTLADRTGEMPLAVLNASERELSVVVRVNAAAVRPRSFEATLTLAPSDNYLTVPVDLGRAVSDDIHVSVWAGDLRIAESTVTVRASYLDRLAMVGMVIVVLIGLLVFIRRRVSKAALNGRGERPSAASAGTMPGDTDSGTRDDATP